MSLMTDGRIFLPFALLRNVKLHMVDLDLPFAIWCLHHIANGRCNLPSVKFEFFEIISTICHVKHFYHVPSAIRHSPFQTWDILEVLLVAQKARIRTLFIIVKIASGCCFRFDIFISSTSLPISFVSLFLCFPSLMLLFILMLTWLLL